MSLGTALAGGMAVGLVRGLVYMLRQERRKWPKRIPENAPKSGETIDAYYERMEGPVPESAAIARLRALNTYRL